MWFDSWSDIGRVLLLGAAAYVTLVVMLRISGKRSLGQLNAFDLVVTVALGSTLATILLSADVSFAEGAAALALLGGLQFVVAWVSSRKPKTRRAFTATPALLLSDGRIQSDALKRNRLTEEELRQVVRSAGAGDLSQIEAVVLEANGTFSVIRAGNYGSGSALQDVPGARDS